MTWFNGIANLHSGKANAFAAIIYALVIGKETRILILAAGTFHTFKYDKKKELRLQFLENFRFLNPAGGLFDLVRILDQGNSNITRTLFAKGLARGHNDAGLL